MIWSIIVGGFIGFVAGGITKKGGAMGIISNGAWGPSLGGMALIPSILGAAIVVTIVSIFFGKKS